MILDMIQEWFKELLIDGIISNLTGMFDTLNTKSLWQQRGFTFCKRRKNI